MSHVSVAFEVELMEVIEELFIHPVLKTPIITMHERHFSDRQMQHVPEEEHHHAVWTQKPRSYELQIKSGEIRRYLLRVHHVRVVWEYGRFQEVLQVPWRKVLLTGVPSSGLGGAQENVQHTLVSAPFFFKKGCMRVEY